MAQRTKAGDYSGLASEVSTFITQRGIGRISAEDLRQHFRLSPAAAADCVNIGAQAYASWQTKGYKWMQAQLAARLAKTDAFEADTRPMTLRGGTVSSIVEGALGADLRRHEREGAVADESLDEAVDSLKAFTGEPRTWTASQRKKAIELLSKWPLSKLRKHQDLNTRQSVKAHSARNTSALENLQAMADIYTAAVMKREFGESVDESVDEAVSREAKVALKTALASAKRTGEIHYLYKDDDGSIGIVSQSSLIQLGKKGPKRIVGSASPSGTTTVGPSVGEAVDEMDVPPMGNMKSGAKAVGDKLKALYDAEYSLSHGKGRDAAHSIRQALMQKTARLRRELKHAGVDDAIKLLVKAAQKGHNWKKAKDALGPSYSVESLDDSKPQGGAYVANQDTGGAATVVDEGDDEGSFVIYVSKDGKRWTLAGNNATLSMAKKSAGVLADKYGVGHSAIVKVGDGASDYRKAPRTVSKPSQAGKVVSESVDEAATVMRARASAAHVSEDETPEVRQAYADWNSRRAYLDNGGNYRLRPEGKTSGKGGKAAPWNKAVKKRFQKDGKHSNAEFHDAAKKHAKHDKGESVLGLVRGTMDRMEERRLEEMGLSGGHGSKKPAARRGEPSRASSQTSKTTAQAGKRAMIAEKISKAEHERIVAKAMKGQGTKVRPIDPAKYSKRKGLEGPFRFRDGSILYYDPKEGSYYDAGKDMYVDAPRESVEEAEGQYRTLNDAAVIEPGLAKGTTEVWYMNPAYFREGIMGLDFARKHGTTPDPSNLSATHILLGKVKETKPERLHGMLQGERWSPNGEARSLVKKKGLKHTSMSMGDVVKIGNRVFSVDRVGFSRLSEDVSCEAALAMRVSESMGAIRSSVRAQMYEAKTKPVTKGSRVYVKSGTDKMAGIVSDHGGNSWKKNASGKTIYNVKFSRTGKTQYIAADQIVMVESVDEAATVMRETADGGKVPGGKPGQPYFRFVTTSGTGANLKKLATAWYVEAAHPKKVQGSMQDSFKKAVQTWERSGRFPSGSDITVSEAVDEATFTRYYEPLPGKPDKKNHPTLKAAKADAAEISKTSGGYVTVMRNGIEVASFRRGKLVVESDELDERAPKAVNLSFSDQVELNRSTETAITPEIHAWVIKKFGKGEGSRTNLAAAMSGGSISIHKKQGSMGVKEITVTRRGKYLIVKDDQGGGMMTKTKVQFFELRESCEVDEALPSWPHADKIYGRATRLLELMSQAGHATPAKFTKRGKLKTAGKTTEEMDDLIAALNAGDEREIKALMLRYSTRFPQLWKKALKEANDDKTDDLPAKTEADLKAAAKEMGAIKVTGKGPSINATFDDKAKAEKFLKHAKGKGGDAAMRRSGDTEYTVHVDESIELPEDVIDLGDGRYFVDDEIVENLCFVTLDEEGFPLLDEASRREEMLKRAVAGEFSGKKALRKTGPSDYTAYIGRQAIAAAMSFADLKKLLSGANLDPSEFKQESTTFVVAREDVIEAALCEDLDEASPYDKLQKGLAAAKARDLAYYSDGLTWHAGFNVNGKPYHMTFMLADGTINRIRYRGAVERGQAPGKRVRNYAAVPPVVKKETEKIIPGFVKNLVAGNYPSMESLDEEAKLGKREGDGAEFPLYQGKLLSWDIGAYMTTAEKRAGFPKARTVIAAMQAHRPDQLKKDMHRMRFAHADRMFGHNAKQYLSLVHDVTKGRYGHKYESVDEAGPFQLTVNDIFDNGAWQSPRYTVNVTTNNREPWTFGMFDPGLEPENTAHDQRIPSFTNPVKGHARRGEYMTKIGVGKLPTVLAAQLERLVANADSFHAELEFDEDDLDEKIYRIGAGGLKPVDTSLYVEPNSSYWLGASSSPSHVVVTAIDDNHITYSSYPYTKTQKIETPIGKSLMASGTHTHLQRYGQYMDAAEKKTLEANLKGKKGPRNGKEKQRDYQRILVTCVANDKTRDLYGQTKAYGVLTGYWEEGKPGLKGYEGTETSDIEVSRNLVPKMHKDPAFDLARVGRTTMESEEDFADWLDENDLEEFTRSGSVPFTAGVHPWLGYYGSEMGVVGAPEELDDDGDPGDTMSPGIDEVAKNTVKNAEISIVSALLVVKPKSAWVSVMQDLAVGAPFRGVQWGKIETAVTNLVRRGVIQAKDGGPSKGQIVRMVPTAESFDEDDCANARERGNRFVVLDGAVQRASFCKTRQEAEGLAATMEGGMVMTIDDYERHLEATADRAHAMEDIDEDLLDEAIKPTLEGWHMFVTGALTEYDQQQLRRALKSNRLGMHNPSAFALYLQALDRGEKKFTSKMRSDKPEDIRAYAAMLKVAFDPDFPPIKKSLKAIDKFLTDNKPPKYPGTAAKRSAKKLESVMDEGRINVHDAMLNHFVKNPGRAYDAKTMARLFGVSFAEAVSTLSRLVNEGTLIFKRGQGYSLSQTGSRASLQLPGATSGTARPLRIHPIRTEDAEHEDYTLHTSETIEVEGFPEDLGEAAVRVRSRQVTFRDWICPHCDEQIGEKSLFYGKLKDGAPVECGADERVYYHSKCGGEIELPDTSESLDEDGERFLAKKYGLKSDEAKKLANHPKSRSIIAAHEKWRDANGLPAASSPLSRGKLLDMLKEEVDETTTSVTKKATKAVDEGGLWGDIRKDASGYKELFAVMSPGGMGNKPEDVLIGLYANRKLAHTIAKDDDRYRQRWPLMNAKVLRIKGAAIPKYLKLLGIGRGAVYTDLRESADESVDEMKATARDDFFSLLDRMGDDEEAAELAYFNAIAVEVARGLKGRVTGRTKVKPHETRTEITVGKDKWALYIDGDTDGQFLKLERPGAAKIQVQRFGSNQNDQAGKVANFLVARARKDGVMEDLDEADPPMLPGDPLQKLMGQFGVRPEKWSRAQSRKAVATFSALNWPTEKLRAYYATLKGRAEFNRYDMNSLATVFAAVTRAREFGESTDETVSGMVGGFRDDKKGAKGPKSVWAPAAIAKLRESFAECFPEATKDELDAMVEAEIGEGVTGPTRMEVQKSYDRHRKTSASVREAITRVEKETGVRNIKVSAKGSVVSFDEAAADERTIKDIFVYPRRKGGPWIVEDPYGNYLGEHDRREEALAQAAQAAAAESWSVVELTRTKVQANESASNVDEAKDQIAPGVTWAVEPFKGGQAVTVDDNGVFHNALVAAAESLDEAKDKTAYNKYGANAASAWMSYVLKIRNASKRAYAKAYLDYIVKRDPQPDPEQFKLGTMAAQAVRMSLADYGIEESTNEAQVTQVRTAKPQGPIETAIMAATRKLRAGQFTMAEVIAASPQLKALPYATVALAADSLIGKGLLGGSRDYISIFGESEEADTDEGVPETETFTFNEADLERYVLAAQAAGVDDEPRFEHNRTTGTFTAEVPRAAASRIRELVGV
jgi:hypothetical protein